MFVGGGGGVVEERAPPHLEASKIAKIVDGLRLLSPYRRTPPRLAMLATGLLHPLTSRPLATVYELADWRRLDGRRDSPARPVLPSQPSQPALSRTATGRGLCSQPGRIRSAVFTFQDMRV